MTGERGQASVEWIAALLVVALALGALAAVAIRVDGRSFGGFLAHRFVCTVRGDCRERDDALRRAYGDRDAELVRRYAPSIAYEPGTLTLPVDWRRCRSHDCSDAPDDPDLDVHRGKRGGTPATAFTHVVHRDGETFIQYWLYYPDSTSTVGGAAGVWNTVRDVVGIGPEYPGFHRDDWESHQIRIDAKGRATVRSSSHHGYQGCKHAECEDEWYAWTGWTRVSYGSHAGHVPTRSPDPDDPAYPGVHTRERTSTGEGLALVPIETLDTGAYERLDDGITPPWGKKVYDDPLSDATD
ncbi:MAG: hypothetical protein WD844_09520 [Thermoleophilaceae bacterium]